jgi:ADP-ribosylglycohydrolase
VADAFMNNMDYATNLKIFARKYPLAGYGGTFIGWVDSGSMLPYYSWGNGSAMRVGSIGWLCNNLDEVLSESKKTAEVTHNHPEGIKGAQAIASAIFLARMNITKEEIKDYIVETFNYNLNKTLAEIRPNYHFDVSCQGSVPEAIISFLESVGFEDCIRKAVSLGGDSDTIAAMAGGIAEAFYKDIPIEISSKVFEIITKGTNFLSILEQFYRAIS